MEIQKGEKQKEVKMNEEIREEIYIEIESEQMIELMIGEKGKLIGKEIKIGFKGGKGNKIKEYNKEKEKEMIEKEGNNNGLKMEEVYKKMKVYGVDLKKMMKKIKKDIYKINVKVEMKKVKFERWSEKDNGEGIKMKEVY